MTVLADLFATGFFNPLAAPGASFYAAALLALLGETRRQHGPISRHLAMQVIDDVLPGEAEVLLDEAVDPTADDDGTDGRSAAVLRYFLRCGWVRQETQADFSVSLILPEPAFRLAGLLHDLQQGSAGCQGAGYRYQ